MAKVEDWFPRWLRDHLLRNPRNDWPKTSDGAMLFNGWKQNFIRKGVAESDADSASIRIQPENVFPERQIGRLLEIIDEIWKERQVREMAHPMDARELARYESRECSECLGVGMTIRYRRKSLGQLDRNGKPHAPIITLYCRCPFGRWLLKNHRETCPEVARRMYDLDDYPWLWGDEYKTAPGPSQPPPAPKPKAKPMPKPEPAVQTAFIEPEEEEIPF